MSGVYKDVFKSLANRDLLIPYLRNAILSDDWPDSYFIKVDSSPYYGLGDGYFHPSTHALMGARELYYMFHPEYRDRLIPEHRDVQDEMTLAMGSSLHAVVQTQFVQSGLLREDDVEVEYVIPEHHVRGRIDFIVDHPVGDRIVVEFKTRNSRSFSFQRKTGILPEWDAQLSMALHAKGQPYGVLLVLESGYPYRMMEFKVPRNDALLSEIFTKFDYVRECIALDIPPTHCCPIGSVQNKDCPARYECWDKGKVAR